MWAELAGERFVLDATRCLIAELALGEGFVVAPTALEPANLRIALEHQ